MILLLFFAARMFGVAMMWQSRVLKIGFRKCSFSSFLLVCYTKKFVFVNPTGVGAAILPPATFRK